MRLKIKNLRSPVGAFFLLSVWVFTLLSIQIHFLAIPHFWCSDHEEFEDIHFEWLENHDSESDDSDTDSQAHQSCKHIVFFQNNKILNSQYLILSLFSPFFKEFSPERKSDIEQKDKIYLLAPKNSPPKLLFA